MVWTIALGIVLGFALLWVLPLLVGVVVVLGTLAFDALSKLFARKESVQSSSSGMKDVTPKETNLYPPEPDFGEFGSWLKWLFTYGHCGRLARMAYVKVKLMILFVTLVGVALGYLVYLLDSTVLFILAIIAMLPFYIIVVYRSISADIQRLHDFDFSGWWVIPALVVNRIPGSFGGFLGLVSLGIFVFVPGTRGPNRFGSVPGTKTGVEKEEGLAGEDGEHPPVTSGTSKRKPSPKPAKKAAAKPEVSVKPAPAKKAKPKTVKTS